MNIDQWHKEPSMHTCRSAAGASVLGKHIYVVGKLLRDYNLISISNIYIKLN